LTREAVEGYLKHLVGGGVILMHISNRYMELADTVAAVGAAEGLVAFIKVDDRPETSSADYKMNAEVVALARRPEDVGDLRRRPGWHQLRSETGVQAWTDDYSNIFQAIFASSAKDGIYQLGPNLQKLRSFRAESAICSRQSIIRAGSRL
jgi:hypothetical protein